MQSVDLLKPDGRKLTLYSNSPIAGDLQAPSPFAEPQGANPHLRWHPLRGEWVAYAAYRQNRTFQPPPEYNPLAPMRDPANPTELPAGDYEIAVFDNRFPTLAQESHDPPRVGVDTRVADGLCEVVVFTQDATASLASLPLARIELLLQVWADRSRRARELGRIQYVLPFENRGAEVGVTLHHPHGQIYAYPFVPPVPARMLAQEADHYARHGAPLLVEMAQREIASAERLLYNDGQACAFVPACARYPYEVWVMPTAPVPDFLALDAAARASLARALKTVLLRYEGLWQRPFPYLMTWYQAPLHGGHAGTQLHAQFWPPYRSKDRLKFLAGTELGAGMFAMDVLPEMTAAQLREVAVELA
jgi:UDPglucose--hexose-1-phosphate uridylyltransferase